MSVRYWIILVALGTAFGTSFAFNELLLGLYGPLTISALRVGLGALGCWAWVLATGRNAGVSGILLVGLAVLGVFQYSAPFALLPVAQQHVTSSAAGIANAMTPVAVVVVSHLWRGGERATGEVFWIILGVAGIAVLATRGAETGGSDPRFVPLSVGAPLCYAIALNMVRRFRAMDPVVVTAWAMTGGAVAIAPAAVALEGLPSLPGPRGRGSAGGARFRPDLGGLPGDVLHPAPRRRDEPVAGNIHRAGVGDHDRHRRAGRARGRGPRRRMTLILSGLAAIDGRIFGRLRRPTATARTRRFAFR